MRFERCLPPDRETGKFQARLREINATPLCIGARRGDLPPLTFRQFPRHLWWPGIERGPPPRYVVGTVCSWEYNNLNKYSSAWACGKFAWSLLARFSCRTRLMASEKGPPARDTCYQSAAAATSNGCIRTVSRVYIFGNLLFLTLALPWTGQMTSSRFYENLSKLLKFKFLNFITNFMFVSFYINSYPNLSFVSSYLAGSNRNMSTKSAG